MAEKYTWVEGLDACREDNWYQITTNNTHIEQPNGSLSVKEI